MSVLIGIRWARSRVICVVVLALLSLIGAAAGADQRLIDREPFDRVTLDSANENRQLEILPSAFADRRIPAPLPRAGTLRAQLVDLPLEDVLIRWANVVEVHLFEQLVLADAKQMAQDGQFIAAHQNLIYLQRYHSKLNGLAAAIDEILELEIAFLYRANDYERAWAVFTALYDRNPEHGGLPRAFDRIVDRRLKEYVEKGEFRKARLLLAQLEEDYSQLSADPRSRWNRELQTLAELRVEAGRDHLASGRLEEARIVVQEALAIEPNHAAAISLQREIMLANPRVSVGVLAAAPANPSRRLDDWASRRISLLVDPALVELRGFTSEGGEYTSPYGELLRDADGLATSLVLLPRSSEAALSAHTVARQLIETLQSGAGGLAASLANQLAEIQVGDVRSIKFVWRRLHVRPEALLRLGLPSESLSAPFSIPQQAESPGGDSASKRGSRGPFSLQNQTEHVVVFRRLESSPDRGASRPIELVERLFASEDDAVEALLRGEIDVLERITPSNASRLKLRNEIVVTQYALPTVHVLIPSSTASLLRLSELKRAIVYGIDRQGIVDQLITSDGPPQSAAVVSGPFPIGTELNDPLAYAYNRSIEPHSFDPRLAGALAEVAARIDASPDAPGEPHPLELTLAHPSQPLPRAACQIIAEQLRAVGIGVRLEELPHGNPIGESNAYDLRYAELAMWEPVVDAGRFLGPRGELGTCSSRMGLALQAVDQSPTWQRVRQSLQEVHQVTHDQLDVIPLWQTTNYFAYRKTITGIPNRPVTLYENIEAWAIAQSREASAE